jgi:ComEC/Rec2-related protein
MKFWASQPRQPLVGLTVVAITGILLADRVLLPIAVVFGVVMVAMLIVLWRPGRWSCWMLCAALFFELHTIQHGNCDARWLAGILAESPRVIKAAGVVWSEPEKPQTFSRNVTCRFVLRLNRASMAGQNFDTDAQMKVSWAGPIPAYGDRVTLVGGASNLEPARNPGEFDSLAYEHRHGVYSEIRARYAIDCQVAGHGAGYPWMAFGLAARHWVQNRLEVDLADSPEATAVIDGIVLGLRGDSPEDLKVLLQRTGTIHLFVVSGLNIAMLVGLMFLLLRPWGLPRNVVFVVIILILAIYTLMTGLRTASVRSAFMASLVLVAALFDRRPLSFNNLAAAALIILALDTDELFAPGFQFSFTVVFVIIAWAAPLQRRMEALAQPDPFLPRVLWSWPLRCRVWCWHRFSVVVGLMVASWLGSLIFTVGYFHLFSPGSLVANFLAVPVAFAILALGLATVLTAKVSAHLVVLFNNANWFAAKVMLGVLHISASLPGGFVYVENPRLGARAKCEITVLDVGDGGAAHVRGGGRDWLVDSGDDYHYGRTVLPYLRSRGVNRLDGLVITHGNVHHMGAALTAIGDFRPSLLAESMLLDRSSTRKKMNAALAEQRLGKGLYARNDLIHLGKAVTVRVLYPPIGLKRSSAADMALVLQLQCGATRALLMSDSGFSTEQWLLENEHDLQSDLIIKGQRPGDLSGTPDFLARVAPRVVVCRGLGYAEPVEKLDAWEKETVASGLAVFRQDKTGAVSVDIGNDGYEVRGFLNGQTFRSRAR